MKKPLLKIYGERNTGTQYLSLLVHLNFDVRELQGVVPKDVMRLEQMLHTNERLRDLYFKLCFGQNLGWKHALVKPPEWLGKYGICHRQPAFITLTKNPYAWLLSLYQRPYHQRPPKGMDFLTFITSPWQTVGRENFPHRVTDPVELWNRKNASYIPLAQHFRTLNLRFEDLLADPDAVMEQISGAFSFGRKHKTFHNHAPSTKEAGKDTAFYRDYYLNERWKTKLTPEAIEVINARLDEEVMRFFRYEKLHPL